MTDEQPWPDNYPDPEDVAEKIDDWASGDGEGVHRDLLTDAVVNLENTAESLQIMAVQLDGLIDSGEFLTMETLHALEDAKSTFQDESAYVGVILGEIHRRLVYLDD